MATPLTVRVVEHQAQIFRRFWRGSATFYVLNPLLFLAAIGFGLGGLVQESTGNVGGVPYDAFVAPGLLAASAMLGAGAESLWPVMAGTKWVRTFHAMVATPVRPADVYAGVVAWTTVRSAVGASYDTFGTERYVLTTENRTLRDVASCAPYEFIEILVNGQTYGGGGIFNQYATVAIDNLWAGYVAVHEFGHHFAGLADEYYTSDVAYLPPANKTEPWEPNVTALLDPANLKWKDLVAAGTPVPTPWDKEEFDRFERDIQQQRGELRAAGKPEAEMDELFRKEREKEDAMLGSQKYAGKVGAFEGANYEAKGYYRPEVDCIMFTRHKTFCAVCRRAIERVIGMYAG